MLSLFSAIQLSGAPNWLLRCNVCDARYGATSALPPIWATCLRSYL